MTIYDRIKFLREQQGMSQQTLAEKVGFKTASAINKIELGLRDINQNKVIAFAKALNTTPSYLMGWEDEQPKTLTFTPDPAALTQSFLTFSFNGTPCAQETLQPSVEVMNEINKLAQILRLCPVEEITALLKFIENGGNIPINPDMPPEYKELISLLPKLSNENIKTLVQVARSMK